MLCTVDNFKSARLLDFFNNILCHLMRPLMNFTITVKPVTHKIIILTDDL